MMNGKVDRLLHRDLVVVGSGIAGMTAALASAPYSVALLTRAELGGGSSSRLAQGGVASALGREDSPVLHAQDTLSVGAGLSNEEVVRVLTHEGPDQIDTLIEMGACFDRDSAGELRLGREAAHSRRRIVHAHGDATGAEIVRALTGAVRQARRIEVSEGTRVQDLIVSRGRVAGVITREKEGTTTAYLSGAVVLATGGAGALYRWTTNPPESTADGLVMAARAGARLADLEFVQFHPTALAVDVSPLPLLTEALRGEGAVLVDQDGDRFMLEEHPLAELAPRDTVARAIWKRLNSGRQVYLDATEAVGRAFPERFPTVFNLCRRHGLDPRFSRMPVRPAAHYHIGGIAADLSGRASIAGLWACGEAAATGVHGANRLASNSILEALVFGRRVAEDLKRVQHSRKIDRFLDLGSDLPRMQDGTEGTGRVAERIRNLMWDSVGLVRSEEGLVKALEIVAELESESDLTREEKNMLTAARLIAAAALERQESRGVHYRSDFPLSDPAWDRHLFVGGRKRGSQRALARAN